MIEPDRNLGTMSSKSVIAVLRVIGYLFLLITVNSSAESPFEFSTTTRNASHRAPLKTLKTASVNQENLQALIPVIKLLLLDEATEGAVINGKRVSDKGTGQVS